MHVIKPKSLQVFFYQLHSSLPYACLKKSEVALIRRVPAYRTLHGQSNSSKTCSCSSFKSLLMYFNVLICIFLVPGAKIKLEISLYLYLAMF